MVKAVKVVTKGTKTSTGGVVLEGHENCTFGGQPATSVGQRASCGRCGKIGLIAANGNHETYLPDGKQAATPHCRVLCDCANNYLLEPSHNAYIGDSRGAGTGQVFLGGNVHFGDNVFINTGSTNASPIAQASQISQGDPVVPPKPKLRSVIDSVEAVTNTIEKISDNVDDEMDKKWLTVPKGQLTFQSEGNDSDGSIYFTRVPHVPNNNGVVIGESGITFGRGLDLGSRTATEVSKLFSEVAKHCKPLSSALLEWLKGGANLKGQKAYDYYKTLNQKVPKVEQHLTRKQQHFLFLEIYPFYEKETERLLTKADVRSTYDKNNSIVWDNLPNNIKDVLVDVTYRGDNKPATRKIIIPSLVLDIENDLKGGSSNLFKVMKDEVWINVYHVDSNRYESRYKELLK